MRRWDLVALFGIALGSFGCAAITVTDDYDRAVDFAALQTWCWHPTAQGGSGTAEPTSLLDARIRSALERQLGDQGLRRVEAGGDFAVSFHTVVATRLEAAASYQGGYGWRPGRATAYTAPEVYTYEEGTLIVDFIDPKSNQIVWRGTASGVVDRQAATAG